jgi:hypothetical protein
METDAMKVRLSPGEIRLRLDDDEIERLETGERLEERLPGMGLRWSCRLNRDGEHPTVRSEHGHLAFEVPLLGAEDWLAGRRIALEPVAVGGDSGSVTLTVERDLRRGSRRPSRPGEPH